MGSAANIFGGHVIRVLWAASVAALASFSACGREPTSPPMPDLDDRTRIGRVVVDSVRFTDARDDRPRTGTLVIERGRVVEIAEPGAVTIRPGDRLVRGEHRSVVMAMTIIVDSRRDLPDVLELRRLFVDGVMTVVIPAGNGAEAPGQTHVECLGELAKSADFRIPRIVSSPDLAPDGPAIDGPQKRGPDAATTELSRISIGDRADLVILNDRGNRDNGDNRRARGEGHDPAEPAPTPAAAAKPSSIRMMLRATSSALPGGVEIIYPGELAMLAGLLQRLDGQMGRAFDEWLLAAEVLGPLDGRGGDDEGVPNRNRHLDGDRVWHRGLFTVDAIPRGVVWTSSRRSSPGPGRDVSAAPHTQTVLRLLEPSNLWAVVSEWEDVAGDLRSVEVAILDLNAPALRDSENLPPEAFWRQVLPVERRRFTVDASGVSPVDPKSAVSETPRNGDAESGTSGPTAVLLSGLPTARTARAVRRWADGAASLDEASTPIRLLRIDVEPIGRRVSIAPASLNRVTRAGCLPNRPLGVDPGDGPRNVLSAAAVEIRALGRDQCTIWLDETPWIAGLVEESAFGFIALIPDDEPVVHPPNGSRAR